MAVFVFENTKREREDYSQTVPSKSLFFWIIKKNKDLRIYILDECHVLLYFSEGLPKTIFTHVEMKDYIHKKTNNMIFILAPVSLFHFLSSDTICMHLMGSI